MPDVADPRGAQLFDGTFPLPTAVLLRDELEHNVATMAAYCAAHGVLLAPHGKTTMCPQIIERQLAAGAWAISVATAWQARTVADMGVRRLVLANCIVDPGSLRLLNGVLAAYDDLEIYCHTDSPAALHALENGIDAGLRGRARVLVEIGVTGGRTGLRDDRDALALAARIADGPMVLAGFSAFEGILHGADLADTLTLVDRLLDRLSGVARTAHADGLIGAGPAPIVTVGGSAYFDRVARRLPPALAGTPYRTVLRSGCYVTHDAGGYEALSPFGARPRAPYRLREALRIWAPVLSRPEPTLALAGLGRRDASADDGLPVPRMVRDRTGRITPFDGEVRVTAVNDQHAYLALPADLPLTVGDVVAFGISHPCTTFDKWRVIPVVDADCTVTELAYTHF
ncbi:alanine racemase [Sphaerisporangium krabiense]|uniref:D-serine deaminase-like pyridoxal phosphate-dependent protein n=1 Tax=Sphaerisporangium krabiense TaxID=763782 RepID=A0A7W9DSI5_9ACTN|nr:alanine racemase [Sphaerisporangium krabiense]MBB5629752.1 D-serine deaminase-like pyridoxal phosphate-dependent protein [Sphaerisporangium krabiense]